PCRELVFPVNAFRNVGNTELVGDPQARMLLELLPRELVSADVEPAPSLCEGDEARHGHRALDHARQCVTDADVFDVARRRSTDLLRPIEREDPREILARVADRLLLFQRLVLRSLLARGVPLGAEAPSVALGHERAALTVELATVDLLDRAAGEAGLMLDQVSEVSLRAQAIAEQNRSVPGDVDAGEH